MPVEITMPQLSDTMSEGTVVKWLKKEGDKVKAGETIAEVETDKATMEMEAFDAGTIALIDAKEGTKVKVGGRIAVLAGAGESIEQVKKEMAGKKSDNGAAAAAPQAPPDDMASVGHEGDPHQHTAPPEASAPKRAPAQAPAPVATAPLGGRVRISPLAKKIAADRGIDPKTVQGSGPGGRIVQRDVEGAASGGVKLQAAPVAAARVGSGQKEIIQLSKIRTTIAQRLQQSKQQIPHFYETMEIDVEELSSIRARMNEHLKKEDIRLSLGDFLAKGICVALQQHPALNAHFNGNQITRFGDVNMGMAVALPDGLIVPVLKNVDQMGLREIRQRSADLVDRARAQKLKGDEMTGATFTVSNLGTYGVKEFSAIINPPEVAILAVGAAEQRAVVRNGTVVPRIMMNITLSADHRAVDGAAAAEFLQTLKSLLEEPGMMLI